MTRASYVVIFLLELAVAQVSQKDRTTKTPHLQLANVELTKECDRSHFSTISYIDICKSWRYEKDCRESVNLIFGVEIHYVFFLLESNIGWVTCGSAIKLTHTDSGGYYQLSSNGHQWGGGSSQQVVTLVRSEDGGHSTLWLVVEDETQTEPCMPGTPIKCGDYIRLTHLQTQKNLHTHQVRSALSGQQEVSAFGENGVGDVLDDWQVMCTTDKQYWSRGTQVRFKHRETGKYLSSSKNHEFNDRNCRNCPILNHLEAAGTGRVDSTSYFKADVGVYLSH